MSKPTIPQVIEDLTTIERNLKRAIASRETITIGGGTFAGRELESLRMAVVNGLAEAKATGNPA